MEQSNPEVPQEITTPTETPEAKLADAAAAVDEAALDAALAAQTEADAVEDKAEGIVEKVELTIEEMYHAVVARVQALEDRLLNHNQRSGHKI